MKNNSERIIAVLISIVLIITVFAGCGKINDDEDKSKDLAVSDLSVMHETEFGGIYADITIDDFNALGFEFGDSVNVEFSNGYKTEDIPYYNGYYVKTGEPLVIGYPGYPYIKICVNNGDDFWNIANADENTTVTISLNNKSKYIDTQEARDIHYIDDRNAYSSDEIFANFRGIQVGTMKDNLVFRSASPCDNQHNRATYVNRLIEQAGIKYIIDLADNDEKIKGYIADENFSCDYFLSLYNNGKVIPLAMNMNFGSDEFRHKAADGLIAMLENDGPYLIHCTEGKDRTGFMCMLLEALSGAGYEDIVRDYMITYGNYYGITKETKEKQYNLIVEQVLNPMIDGMAGKEIFDYYNEDLSSCAEQYLMSGGMTSAQINAIREKIVKS